MPYLLCSFNAEINIEAAGIGSRARRLAMSEKIEKHGARYLSKVIFIAVATRSYHPVFPTI